MFTIPATDKTEKTLKGCNINITLMCGGRVKALLPPAKDTVATLGTVTDNEIYVYSIGRI